MSQQIDTALIKSFHSNFERLLQQKGSRFRDAVRNESQSAESDFWDQIGAVEAEEVVTRHGDSPQVDTPHDRRMVTLRKYDVGDFLDRWDKVQMLADPTSVYTQNFVDALNRKRDALIYSKFFGTAKTGKEGGTSVTSGWNVVNEDFGGTDSKLTIPKLLKAREYLRAAQVDEDDPLFIAIDAAGFTDLLSTTEVASADYNTVKALSKGEISDYMGLKFIHYEPIANTANQAGGGGGATLVKRYPVWAKSGMLHTTAIDILTRIAERPDKRFSWYAYAAAMFGATRMQELKVVEIQSFVS